MTQVSEPTDVVLALDPGRDKCGLAVVRRDGTCTRREVVPTSALNTRLRTLAVESGATVIVYGDRTGRAIAEEALRGLPHLHGVAVDEHRSTEAARALYFTVNPPRGLRRLLPRGFLVPPCPVDDYAAWVLGRRYFSGHH